MFPQIPHVWNMQKKTPKNALTGSSDDVSPDPHVWNMQKKTPKNTLTGSSDDVSPDPPRLKHAEEDSEEHTNR